MAKKHLIRYALEVDIISSQYLYLFDSKEDREKFLEILKASRAVELSAGSIKLYGLSASLSITNFAKYRIIREQHD